MLSIPNLQVLSYLFYLTFILTFVLRISFRFETRSHNVAQATLEVNISAIASHVLELHLHAAVCGRYFIFKIRLFSDRRRSGWVFKKMMANGSWSGKKQDPCLDQVRLSVSLPKR